MPIYSWPAAGQAYFRNYFLLLGPRAAGKQEQHRPALADVLATAMISGKLGSGAGIVLPSDPEVRLVQFMRVSMIVA